jgi:HEAT repeat protein
MASLSALALASIALFSPQDPTAVRELADALAKGDEGARIAALDAAAGSTDPAIANAVGRALGDRSTRVAVVAANALGSMRSDAALAVLHQAAGASGVAQDRERLAAVFRAIGPHGNRSSIAVLSRSPTTPPDYRVIRARIYSLAQIRDLESVQALLGMMALDLQTEGESAFFLEDFRVALMVLTGVDHGPSNFLWDDWWRRSRQGFRLPAGRPVIAEFHRLRWEGGTGAPYVAELPARAPADTSGWTLERATTAAQGSNAAEREAALAFLGSTDDAAALAVLHRLAASATVQGNPEVFAAVLRAIGRRGAPSSVSVLSDRPMAVRDFQVVLARIYGLANVRTKESVDALIALIQLASPVPGEGFIFVEDAAAGLHILTGHDRGIGKESWVQWWRAQRASFAVPAERPWLPPLPRLRYAAFWGEDYTTPRTAPTRPDDAGMDLAAARRALSGSDPAQRLAALSALSRSTDSGALQLLHRTAGSRATQSDPRYFAEVLSAIGRRGDRSSVSVLADKPLSVFDYDVIRARIYALANIRTTESIDALMSAMTLASPPPGEPFVFIDDLRTALCVLTGTDHGPWKTAWNQWWRQNRQGFVVPEDRPEIAPLLALRWEGARGEPYGR